MENRQELEEGTFVDGVVGHGPDGGGDDDSDDNDVADCFPYEMKTCDDAHLTSRLQLQFQIKFPMRHLSMLRSHHTCGSNFFDADVGS